MTPPLLHSTVTAYFSLESGVYPTYLINIYAVNFLFYNGMRTHDLAQARIADTQICESHSIRSNHKLNFIIP